MGSSVKSKLTLQAFQSKKQEADQCIEIHLQMLVENVEQPSPSRLATDDEARENSGTQCWFSFSLFFATDQLVAKICAETDKRLTQLTYSQLIGV